MVSSTRRTRSLKAAGLFAVTMAMLVAPLQGVAQADTPDPSITVTVQKPGGSDTVPNADVSLYDTDGNQVGEGTTDGFGMFTFDRLSGTTYKVGVNKDGYVPWYFNDKSDLNSADTIDVTGSPTQSITAQLATSRVIAGHVTMPAGVNRDNVYVEAMTFRDGDWMPAGSDNLDADGDYAVSGLADGTYRIAVTGGESFPEVWYGAAGTYDVANATDISVAGANVTGKDIVANPPSVSGTVTDTSGSPVGDATVVFHDSGYNFYYAGQTDAAGKYTVFSRPVSGELEFNADGYDRQYYDHVADESNAQVLDLTQPSNHLTGKDAELASSTATNVITGKVTGPGGLPISGADIELYDSNGDQVDTAMTGGQGRYTLYVNDGTYKLHLAPDSGSSTGLHGQWYDGAATKASATPITINGDAKVANFQMTGGGTVSGTVTSAGGPLAGIGVTVYRYDSSDDWWQGAATTTTDAAGKYTVVAPAGNVRVQFSGTGVADQYYANATDIDSATDVHVTSGGTVTGIDAAMAALTKVTGTVTSGGDPVGWADISFYSNSGSFYGYANALGKYTAWVAPGTYRASASANGYSTDRHGVTVGSASPQSGVNFSLDADGWVSGTVKDGSNVLIAGASVTVETPDGDTWDGSTNVEGAYRIYVPTGTGYKLQVAADGYVSQYYKNARNAGAATTFPVNAGAGTTLDPMTLTKAGALAGTVTRGGSAVAGAKVTVYKRDRANRDGWGRVDTAVTGSAGTWSVEGLDPDVAYHVGVQAGSQEQFAPNAGNVRAAADLTVPSGGTTDASVELAAPTHLSGTVTASANGTGVADVQVTVQRKHTDRFGKFSWQAAGSVTTSANGSYDVLASPGTYRLKFTDNNRALLTSWYVADGSWSSHKQDADEIDATSGNVTGLDVAMPAGNTISGHITVGGALGVAASVTVFTQDGSGGWEAGPDFDADGSGDYRASGLPAGTYRICAYAHAAKSACFSEDIGFAGLDGTRAGADFDLTPQPLHTISGTVADLSGTALEEVRVEIDVKLPDGTWETDQHTWTGDGGRFEFDEPAGDYRVAVITDGVHAGTSRMATVSGGDVDLGQIKLDALPTDVVSGTVTGANNTPLSGAAVMLCTSYDVGDVADYDCEDGRSVSGVTDASGGYSLTGVDGRDYVLIVADDAAGYVVKKLPVHLDGDKTINVALQKGGSIAGTVSAPGGVDGGFEVEVYSLETYSGGTYWDNTAYSYVDAGADYSVPGLNPGTYRVCVNYYDNSLADQCYNGVVGRDVENATDVDVTSGNTTTVNFSLQPTMALHGSITDSVTHEKLDDIDVTAYRKVGTNSWLSVGGASTYDGSDYEMRLPAGNYALSLYDEDGDYPETVFASPLTTKLDNAALVNVSGDTTQDVALVKGGAIAGTVKWKVGADKYNWFTTVQAVDKNSGEVVQTTTVSSGDPYFALMGLAQGTYRLDFARASQQRLSGLSVPEAQFSTNINEGDGPGGATPYAVTPGSVTTGADATLHDGLVLSGTISSPNDVPLAGCEVKAYTADGSLVSRWSSYSDDAGHYDLGGLTNGSYRLRISQGDAYGDCIQGDRYLAGSDGSTSTAESAATVTISRTGTNTQNITYGDPIPTLQNTGLPTISGSPAPGNVLQATNGTWTPPDGLSFSYQWFDGGLVPISTTSSYQVQAGDIGKQITVQVTASRAGYLSASASSAAVAVLGQAVTITGKPAISGTPKVGEQLSAGVGTVVTDPADATLGYQWLRNGAPISGATTGQYILTGDDEGTDVSVAVVGSKSGLASSAPVASSSLHVGAGTITHAGPVPPVTGTVAVGQTLTAPTIVWTPADATPSYQWLRDGAEIATATSSTYPVGTDDIGKKLSVRITGSKAHYASDTVTSAETVVVPTPVVPAISNVTAPGLTGTPQVGRTLTATPGTWSPADATVTLQWLRNGVAIGGATKATYVLTATDLGKQIRVRATASKSGMTGATADSAVALTVAAGKITGATPTIKGKAKVGKKLTVSAGATSPSGVTVKYQWLRNGKVIKKATKSSYKVTAKDKGKKLSVRVTRSKAGYTTLALTSKAIKAKK